MYLKQGDTVKAWDVVDQAIAAAQSSGGNLEEDMFYPFIEFYTKVNHLYRD